MKGSAERLKEPTSAKQQTQCAQRMLKKWANCVASRFLTISDGSISAESAARL